MHAVKSAKLCRAQAAIVAVCFDSLTAIYCDVKITEMIVVPVVHAYEMAHLLAHSCLHPHNASKID